MLIASLTQTAYNPHGFWISLLIFFGIIFCTTGFELLRGYNTERHSVIGTVKNVQKIEHDEGISYKIVFEFQYPHKPDKYFCAEALNGISEAEIGKFAIGTTFPITVTTSNLPAAYLDFEQTMQQCKVAFAFSMVGILLVSIFVF